MWSLLKMGLPATLGGTTHRAQAGQTQVLIHLTAREAPFHFLEAWGPCLIHGRHGTIQPGYPITVGAWAMALGLVLDGTTDGTADGAGTILTAGTTDGAMAMTLMATTPTDGTTDGVGTTDGTTILGPLMEIPARVKEQPQLQAPQLEQTTAIVDLQNTPQLEVRV